MAKQPTLSARLGQRVKAISDAYDPAVLENPEAIKILEEREAARQRNELRKAQVPIQAAALAVEAIGLLERIAVALEAIAATDSTSDTTTPVEPTDPVVTPPGGRL